MLCPYLIHWVSLAAFRLSHFHLTDEIQPCPNAFGREFQIFRRSIPVIRIFALVSLPIFVRIFYHNFYHNSYIVWELLFGCGLEVPWHHSYVWRTIILVHETFCWVELANAKWNWRKLRKKKLFKKHIDSSYVYASILEIITKIIRIFLNVKIESKYSRWDYGTWIKVRLCK